MPKGYGGMPGGNMNNLLKQAQKMQRQMAQVQEDLEERTIEATSGGGAVKIRINGKKEIISISLAREVVDPDDIEMLQDILLTAVNEAMRQVDELVNGEMGKITGGMNIPGMF